MIELRIAGIAALLALSGCAFISTYTFDRAAADAYRAKYLPECQRDPDPTYAELVDNKVKGASVPQPIVRAVLNENYRDISGCFNETSEIWPELGGRVVLKFVVLPDGHVRGITIAENDIPIRALVCCLIGKMRTWTFPPPEAGENALGTASFRFRRRTGYSD